VHTTTLLDIPPEEQAQMLAALRRSRYGDLLALHILVLCATGRPPTEIAAFLLCSRTSLYRTVQAYRGGTLGFLRNAHGQLRPPLRPTGLTWPLQQALATLLATGPQTFGWCRTRWSCATLALTLHAQHGVTVSAETVRRWLHALDWVWKRATLIAKDNHPCRAERLARIRGAWEHLQPWEALVFADERDIHLFPKVGAMWMPKGTPGTVMTPGQNATHSLAGALDVPTGELWHGLGARKTHALFRALLDVLEECYPAPQYRRLYVVVDNCNLHQAKAVAQWLESHPRVQWLFLPPYCPRANPMERAFGDVHDKCTRNHTRTHLEALGGDVEQPLERNGPWCDHLSHLYYAPEVTTAMEALAAEEWCQVAALVRHAAGVLWRWAAIRSMPRCSTLEPVLAACGRRMTAVPSRISSSTVTPPMACGASHARAGGDFSLSAVHADHPTPVSALLRFG
jgi:transposase